jgi:hypothetical protein
MKDDDLRPKGPEGYTVMLGKDFTTEDVPIGTKGWTGARWSGGFLERQEASQMIPDVWYAVPNAKVVSDARQSLVEEATAIVAGDRAADYGDVNESFARIAKLWSAYTGSHISSWDVAQMMILLKVSRAKTSTKRDTLVDIIGYAECANQLGKTKT